LLGGFMGAAIAFAGSLSVNGVDVVNYAKVLPTFFFIFGGSLYIRLSRCTW